MNWMCNLVFHCILCKRAFQAWYLLLAIRFFSSIFFFFFSLFPIFARLLRMDRWWNDGDGRMKEAKWIVTTTENVVCCHRAFNSLHYTVNLFNRFDRYRFMYIFSQFTLAWQKHLHLLTLWYTYHNIYNIRKHRLLHINVRRMKMSLILYYVQLTINGLDFLHHLKWMSAGQTGSKKKCKIILLLYTVNMGEMK